MNPRPLLRRERIRRLPRNWVHSHTCTRTFPLEASCPSAHTSLLVCTVAHVAAATTSSNRVRQHCTCTPRHLPFSSGRYSRSVFHTRHFQLAPIVAGIWLVVLPKKGSRDSLSRRPPEGMRSLYPKRVQDLFPQEPNMVQTRLDLDRRGYVRSMKKC